MDIIDLKYRIQMAINRKIMSKWYKLHLKQMAWDSVIVSPLRIIGSQYLSIGSGVVIDKYGCIYAFKKLDRDPDIKIMDRVRVGHFSHIVCINKITIENDVLMADRVYISDDTHDYKDIHVPIKDQPIKEIAAVRIGEGSWIGENACIIGANIGKHCVVGSNTVVTKDAPDYSVVVGCPGKIIKKYDFERNEWIRV